MKTILFLCTGNYYRSRFAEILFNEQAQKTGLAWRAESRGLATEKGIFNIGPISDHTLQRLERAKIACELPHRLPMQCSQADLAVADRVIALKEAEHRPMMVERFADWADRIQYWHVHDLDMAKAEDALKEIEQLVGKLVHELGA